ncbi:MAG: hypothetical protein VXW81_07300, partial [Pseudomonadota bacterium]|nr:hypothetical protein [Pseudomonadota bacterium]
MRRQPQPLSWALSRPLERAPRQVPRVAAPLMPAWRRVLVPLALAVVVAGCAAKGPQPACPTVDVINDLHRTTVFAAGGAGDPAAVSHTLRIADFSAQCVYRKNAITLPVTVTLSGTAVTPFSTGFCGDEPMSWNDHVVLLEAVTLIGL